MFKVMGRQLPPPAGAQSPSLWGTETHLRKLFGDTAAKIAVTQRVFNFRYRSAAHFVDIFRTWYGPVHKAFAALPADKAAELERDLVDLLDSLNRAGSASLVVPERVPGSRRHPRLIPGIGKGNMDPRRQRRIQRYGWDLAVEAYEALWQAPLAPAQAKLLELASLAPGERVLDVAAGTGFVTFAAARAVGEDGLAVGVDLSGLMVETARRRADVRRIGNVALRAHGRGQARAARRRIRRGPLRDGAHVHDGPGAGAARDAPRPASARARCRFRVGRALALRAGRRLRGRAGGNEERRSPGLHRPRQGRGPGPCLPRGGIRKGGDVPRRGDDRLRRRRRGLRRGLPGGAIALAWSR